MIDRVEQAYAAIGLALTAHVNHPGWEQLTLIAPILNLGLGGTVSISKCRSGIERDIPLGIAIFDVQEAALFLRDDLLRSTGQRIWGLTFTLYPNGKMHIEYDYNKPEGYVESDETIDLGEALKGIGIQLPDK